jgi:7-cyano-7-deazaguanine synthase
MKKQAIIVHSGGLDSSLCLALAMKEFNHSELLSLSFKYGQRHSQETVQAEKICKIWNIDHTLLSIDCLEKITNNALIGNSQQINQEKGKESNTLVIGRNGLMARLAAIHAENLGAHCIYMGVIQEDAKKMGYRDCTREYMDLKQQILRMDLSNPAFEIRTPLVYMTKKETLELSYREGILEFLLQETISCYEGIPLQGCMKCPTCKIRNDAIQAFMKSDPTFSAKF